MERAFQPAKAAGACRGLAPFLALQILLLASDAHAQVVVTPGAPSGLRQLCVNTSGVVTIDALTNLCTGGQTGLTSISVGTGPGTTTIDGTGVTLGSGTTLTAGGSATVGGTLGVTGNTSLSTLSTSGAATLNSVGVTNNATVGGTLGVTGATTTAGITNTGSVATTTLSTSGAATLNSVGVTNNATVGGTLGVTGNTSLSTLSTSGAATLNSVGVTNDATVGGTLGVTGLTSTGSLAVGAGGMAVAGGAPVSMGGNRVQNVAAPVAATDAANKAYVDAAIGGANIEGLEAALQQQTARINSAFREIDKNTEGIAVAMAMGGLALPQGKVFAIGANLGTFQDKQAAAVQTLIRLNETLTLNGGVGVGFGASQVGGRVGLMAAW